MASAAGAWLFGGIAEDVLIGDAMIARDLGAKRWFHSHQTPWLNGVRSGVSWLRMAGRYGALLFCS
jgi:hypothetical protein